MLPGHCYVCWLPLSENVSNDPNVGIAVMRKLARELGVSETALLHYHTSWYAPLGNWTRGKQWESYESEEFGLVIPHAEWVANIPVFLRGSLTNDSDPDNLHFEPWLVRVRHRNSHLWVEWRRTEPVGRNIAMRGLRGDEDKLTLMRAARAIKLLRANFASMRLRPFGRPKGSRNRMPLEAFPARREEMRKAFVTEYGWEPNETELAYHMEMPRSTYYDYLRDSKDSLSE